MLTEYISAPSLYHLLKLADEWMSIPLGWAMRDCKITIGSKTFIAVNPGYRPAGSMYLIDWHERGSHPALYKPESITINDFVKLSDREVRLFLQTEDHSKGLRESPDTRPWRTDKIVTLQEPGDQK